MTGPPEPEYELVMPFIACRSKGGPYDDDGFVAGYQCGTVDAGLQLGLLLDPLTVRSDLVPQLDIIAMRHGYRMTVGHHEDDGDPPEWTLVHFVPRISADDW